MARLNHAFPALAARARPGVFAAGVLSLAADQVWSSDDNGRYPLQGVAVVPIAAAALAEVDAGRLSLNEPIRIDSLDLSPPPSAINETWRGASNKHVTSMPAADLIALTVEKGDSTAADVIMKRIGGPGAVTAWLRARNIENMRIDRYQRELRQDIAGMASFHPEWKGEAEWIAARNAVPPLQRQRAMDAFLVDSRDTTTVQGALHFLRLLSLGELLSVPSTRLLLRLMSTGVDAGDRFRAGLPRGAAISRKSGGARTDLGFSPTDDEIAVVTLPDGRRVLMAAFLAGSTATVVERDRLFADTARLFTAALS
ncbi:MAG: serine hydrolase [Caulobacteraceae bacterium]